ncbi:MAG: cytochrome c [Rhodobacteraceae bacterium]|nr:cytochrome c [Paracoccaceae bacterium]
MRNTLIFGAAIGLAVGAYFGLLKNDLPAQTTTVSALELTEIGTRGEEAFNGTCAACHGVNLVGTNNGPPLLHQFYVPGHHGDMSIVLAVKQGSRQHHWRFGDMPAQEHITDAELTSIIAYVREVQRANGFN